MKWFDDLKLREKSIIVVAVSVIIPMLLTNIFFFWSIEKERKSQSIMEMKNDAGQIEYDIRNSVREAISIADYLGHMEKLDDFLKKKYESESDYYEAYSDFMENETIRYYYTAQSAWSITICTENPTIINGTYFVNKSNVESASWYKKFKNSGRNYMVQSFFENGESDGYVINGRHIVVIEKLNYYGGNDIIMLDLDYSKIQKSVTRTCGQRKGYVLDDRGNVLVSAGGGTYIDKPFSNIADISKKGITFERDCEIYGKPLKILIVDQGKSWIELLREKSVALFLICMFNMILPIIVMFLFYHSINDRLSVMGKNIDDIKNDRYKEIELETTHDELGMVIQSYNLMVARIRELIETVYKNKEREQELLIAKKQAEIHAIQSQINPHFLFNALESIRMHSLIKKENETANILENFSVLLRENIQWDNDIVTVEKECKNVQRYLELQQYRFGNRLDYSVRVQDECKDIMIPKFSIVTFVENSCIHGIETSVDGGSIAVVVSKDEGMLYLEIMDSGGGMSDEELSDLKNRIETADIKYLESAKKSIGIVNTVIRLKQLYGENFYIDINSSVGGGTEICIVLKCEEEE
ncbi:two-component system, sensor histidine kinase YesM [Lachnospiraceae bacterium]|nr:two-component system, sensor histidine kinase YesM [Lachnospiraceae bacterium]